MLGLSRQSNLIYKGLKKKKPRGIIKKRLFMMQNGMLLKQNVMNV